MSLVREDHNVLLSLVVVSVFVDFIFHRESHEKFLQNEKLGVKKKTKSNRASCVRFFPRFEVIAGNSDWSIVMFFPVLIGGSGYFGIGLIFRQSFENRCIRCS